VRGGTGDQRRELLAAVDEANLVLDHAGQVNVFLVAGLLAPGGFVARDGRVDLAALRAALGERVAALPALCRVPVVEGRRHRWVERSPDLEWHIRLVDPVDGLEGLEHMCAELMTAPLTRERPMWEILVAPGAIEPGVGMVLRIHHAIADGMAAVAIVKRLFDAPGPNLPPTPARPDQPTTTATPDPVRHGPDARLRKLAFGLRRIVSTVVGRGIGATVLLGDRGPRRGVVFVDVDLLAFEAHVRALGATVNDGLLASVAAGYAAALSAADETVPSELPVSIPVALGRHGSSGNQVGVMLVHLPLLADPDERLRLIADRTRTEKIRAREQGTLEFMRGPVGARILDRIARRQHLVAGFVTNVPGPSGRLQLAGAPIEAIWPVAVLAANVRLGVAAVSYDGWLRCGVHFDLATVPGAVFAQAMRQELNRLTG
jgi:diacylglycerol O-acyltransferase / wax synthase